MTSRARVLVLLFVLSVLPDGSRPRLPLEERYSVLLSNEKAGYVTATIDGSRVDIVQHIDENGRGPKTQETLTLDAERPAHGMAHQGQWWTGGPVDERFTQKGGRARWKTLNDSGDVQVAENRLYIANNASVWAYSFYMRALLAAPNQRLATLPSGRNARGETARDRDRRRLADHGHGLCPLGRRGATELHPAR